MSDISKHLGDERRLRLSINKIKEVISKSTPVVNWYAHTEDKTVRGPFGRWFTASGEDKHLANINNDVEYCAMAMTILPEMVEEIQQLKQQLSDTKTDNINWMNKNKQLKQQLEKAERLLSKYEIIHMDKPNLIDVHNDIKDYFLSKALGE